MANEWRWVLDEEDEEREQLREIEAGIRDAEAGEFASPAEVGAFLEKWTGEEGCTGEVVGGSSARHHQRPRRESS